jgi:large subunit ribosomal protein L9
MKVILKQDVKNLGKKETMIEVSDGYARNYLIPKGLAVEANSTNINIMNTKKDAEKSKHEKELANAKNIAKQISDTTLAIKTKAGESGKLFGSITGKDIAEKLKKDYNIDIDRKKIIIDEAIKTTGTFDIEIKIYPGVSSTLKLKIIHE